MLGRVVHAGRKLNFVKDAAPSVKKIQKGQEDALRKLKRIGKTARSPAMLHQASLDFVDTLQIMILDGITPQHEHYLMTFNRLRQLRQLDTARIVWQMMEREKVTPDYKLASMMLKICAEARRPDWAFEVWNRYCSETPWLEPGQPDPLPPPPPAKTLDKLTYSELKALPMWKKIHHDHPNLTLGEKNRYNITREMYLNMIRCMAATGHFEAATQLMEVLQEKLLTTPTPKREPSKLASFNKEEQPFQELTTRGRRKMEHFESARALEEGKLLRDYPTVPNPWRPHKKSYGRDALRLTKRATKSSSNLQFLYYAYCAVVRHCTTDGEQAWRFAEQYCQLLAKNRRVHAALISQPSQDRNSANTRILLQFIRTVRKYNNRVKGMLKHSAAWDAALSALKARDPASLSEEDKLQLASLERMRREKQELDLMALKWTIRTGDKAQLVKILDMQGVKDQAVRAKCMEAQKKKRERGIDVFESTKYLQRSPGGQLGKMFLWLRILRSQMVPIIRTLGLQEAKKTNPYEIASPRLRQTKQHLTSRRAAGDLNYLFGSLLDAKRCNSPNGFEVYALMRKLTNPEGHPLGSTGRAVADSKMYQTCLMAFLQQLGMPGKYAEGAQGHDDPEEKAQDLRIKLIETLRQKYGKPEHREEALKIAAATKQLWGEFQFAGLDSSMSLHNLYMQIMAITNPAPRACHSHFEEQVHLKFKWDSMTATCLLLECYDAPSYEERHEGVWQIKNRMDRYRVKPNITLRDFMDSRADLCGVHGNTQKRRKLIEMEAEYEARVQQSRGNEALLA